MKDKDIVDSFLVIVLGKMSGQNRKTGYLPVLTRKTVTLLEGCLFIASLIGKILMILMNISTILSNSTFIL